MDSPGFVQLLSHSSWFCAASTKWSGTSDFILILLSSLHNSLLVLCGFSPTAPDIDWLPHYHNSLNTNPN